MSEVIAEPGGEAPLAPEAGAPEAGGEQPWSLSQDEWQQSLERQNAIMSYIEQQQAAHAPAPQEPQLPDYDPFDPQSVADFFARMLDERLAPINSWQEQMRGNEAEERALDIMEADVAAHGELLEQESAFQNVRANAEAFYQQAVLQHGEGTKAAEVAIAQAMKAERAYQDAVGKAYYARITNQMRTLDGAASEPGSRYAQGAQELIVGDYTGGGRVSDKFFGGQAA